jgi:hypothetical protein
MTDRELFTELYYYTAQFCSGDLTREFWVSVRCVRFCIIQIIIVLEPVKSGSLFGFSQWLRRTDRVVIWVFDSKKGTGFDPRLSTA